MNIPEREAAIACVVANVIVAYRCACSMNGTYLLDPGISERVAEGVRDELQKANGLAPLDTAVFEESTPSTMWAIGERLGYARWLDSESALLSAPVKAGDAIYCPTRLEPLIVSAEQAEDRQRLLADLKAYAG